MLHKKREVTEMGRFDYLPLFVFAVIVMLSGISGWARADSIDCNKYQLSELRALCQYAVSNDSVFVHEHVPQDGLNDLVDSWGANEFHIIPHNTYTLDRPVVLDGITLMPTPPVFTSGQALQTIELTTSSEFQYSADNFHLFGLQGDACAGGIEIHGDKLPDSLSDLPSGSSLVYFDSNQSNDFTGNILTGDSRINILINLGSSWADGTEGNTLNIHRNYLLLNSSSTGALISRGGDSTRTPHLYDNAFLISPARSTTTAVKSDGDFKMRNNDIVYLNADDSNGEGSRYGVEVSAISSGIILNNAFYSTSANRKNSDISIFSHRDSLYSNSWLIMAGNGFSSDITPAKTASGSGSSINLLETGSVLYQLHQTYPRMTPESFFASTGSLGFVTSSVAWLTSTNETFCSADYKPYESNDESLSENAQSLISLLWQGTVCEQCPKWYDNPDVQFQIPFAVAVFVIALISAPLGCWGCHDLCRGQCRLPGR